MKTKSEFKSKNLFFLIAVLVLSFIIPASVFSQTVIEIQVSPNILNLQSNGVVVTIHTNIAYSTVDASTVSLCDVEIDSWKSDNGGFFVAKFDMDEIKDIEELVIGEYNTLTLDGFTVSGDAFTGSEEVMVINNIPQGKK